MEDAGQKLKQVRERLGLTYREVEEYSGRIARVRGSEEYSIALSRLSDIENKRTMPSLYRLYSLCAIYRLEMTEVLSWYGILLSNLPADAALLPLSRTHRVGFQSSDDGEAQVPLSLDPGLDPSKTFLFSRYIQRWGRIPLMMLNRQDLRENAYGLIGTDDWSMYPILAPGALVVIDQSRRRIQNTGWTSEYDRPIYFLESHNAYLCGWCTQRESHVIVQFHPSSQQDPEVFELQKEIEVIGQVVAVAMSLDPVKRRRPRD
jgi:transcriptional regulator with XRE-family HTH domain